MRVSTQSKKRGGGRCEGSYFSLGLLIQRDEYEPYLHTQGTRPIAKYLHTRTHGRTHARNTNSCRCGFRCHSRCHCNSSHFRCSGPDYWERGRNCRVWNNASLRKASTWFVFFFSIGIGDVWRGLCWRKCKSLLLLLPPLLLYFFFFANGGNGDAGVSIPVASCSSP